MDGKILIKSNGKWLGATVIYAKVNGKWVKVKSVYKKVSGSWQQQKYLSAMFDQNALYVSGS